MTNQDQDVSVRRPLVMGICMLAVLLLGGGVWGTTTTVSGAVMAQGIVRVEGDKRIISHEGGGLVAELMVRDGDKVQAGQTLLVLEDTVLQAQLDGVQDELLENLVARARWRAHAKGAQRIDLEADLDPEMSRHPALAERVARHQTQLAISQQTLLRSITQQRQIIEQIKEQIRGDDLLLESLRKQSELIAQQIANKSELVTRGISKAAVLLDLQRQHTKMLGDIGVTRSAKATKEQRLIELEAVIDTLDGRSRKEALQKLSELEAVRARLVVKRAEIDTQIQKLVVRAPLDGTVYGNTVSGAGALVVPRVPILSIIPATDVIAAEVRVSASDIDQVYLGQEATIRFSAYNARALPIFIGTVQAISGDTVRDAVSKTPAYIVRIELPSATLTEAAGVHLVNGMQLSAFLTTSEQTPLQYVTRPIQDFFHRAMRDT